MSSDGIHQNHLSSEDQFKEDIDDLELESIFDDMILQAHPNNSMKVKIDVPSMVIMVPLSASQ
jgi:hypothetical protein